MKEHNYALESLIERGYEFKFSKYINDGFNLFKQNIGGFVLYYLIIITISVIGSFLFYGIINILQPVFIAGVFLVANEILKGKNNVPFDMFFKGFNFFVPLILMSIISAVFIFVGTLLFIVPGIYLAISYQFASMLIVFLGYDFWDAMELSRRIITKKWWSFFGFIIVIGLINVLGAITIIGTLFTVPATMCMLFCVFEDIVGSAVRQTSNNNSNDSNTTYTYNI